MPLRLRLSRVLLEAHLSASLRVASESGPYGMDRNHVVTARRAARRKRLSSGCREGCVFACGEEHGARHASRSAKRTTVAGMRFRARTDLTRC